jgi:hypothetical protein
MKRTFALALSALLICCLCVPTFAHSGKTDINGGHYDSSTGEYHYHHGYPAHSHPNGECPYNHSSGTSSSNISTEGVIDTMLEIISAITPILIVVALAGFFIFSCFSGIFDSYAKSKGYRSKELEEEFNERKKQLDNEHRQRMELLDIREKALAAREKRLDAWMQTFSPGECNVQRCTQDVIDFHSNIRSTIEPHINALKKIERQSIVYDNAWKDHVRKSTIAIEKQEQLLLSYTQSLAGFLHHFGKRVQELREHEQTLKDRENDLLADSPYIVGKAFERIYEKTSSIFYRSQAASLNSYFERVKDERFERAIFGEVHYTTGPAVICRMKSNDKKHPQPYITSLSTCTCQDFQIRHQPCKHMLFLAYHTGYLFLNKEKLESSVKQYFTELHRNKSK